MILSNKTFKRTNYGPVRGTLCRTRTMPVARLFAITRLHSHEPSVLVETETSSTTMATQAGAGTNGVPATGIASTTMQSRGVTAVPAAAGYRRALQATAGRKLFYPTSNALKYLDGSLPGDYGWDPLGLADPYKRGQPGEDKFINLKWMSYAELIHGRWAMLAAAGAVAPEALAMMGVIPQKTGLPWFEAGGLFSQAPGGIQGIPFLGDIPFTYWADKGTLLFTMLVAMGFAELRRLQDYKNPGSMSKQYFLGLESIMQGSGDAKYPGGQFFDLFGLSATLAKDTSGGKLFDMRVKEVKHGRLAMVAWLGFMVQACTTHQGPVQNLLDHMASAGTNNMFARIGDFCIDSTPAQQINFVLWLAAGFAAGALYTYAQDDQGRGSERAAPSVTQPSVAQSAVAGDHQQNAELQ